jgi:hypothetical protein
MSREPTIQDYGRGMYNMDEVQSDSYDEPDVTFIEDKKLDQSAQRTIHGL